VDLSGAFVNGILAIIGYVVMFVGVYKVYQIATDIREMKELMVRARRNPLGAGPLTSGLSPGVAPEITKDLLAEDSAAAYAQSLLRAVNAESRETVTESQELR